MSEPNGNHQATSTLFIHAQTPLHPGSGTALGVVDLPVQRERHTGWPLIPGTSLKGVLRDAAERVDSNGDVVEIFGPETSDADKHAGAAMLTDARLLAFPVRSLRGVFAWVTCPSVLDRFNRDLELAGLDPAERPAPPATHEALCPSNSPLRLDGESAVVLEEFDFTITGDCSQTADRIATLAMTASGATGESLKRKLVVLSDDQFTHFARHGTEIVARIGLDPETKTVSRGALFYQEFLPTESLFYSVLVCSPSRGKGNRSAGDVSAFFGELIGRYPVLQIGGDETTGKGLCGLKLATNQE